MTTSRAADLEATKTLNSAVAGIHKSLVTLETVKQRFIKLSYDPEAHF